MTSNASLARSYTYQALLIPKLRSHYAEFLRDGYLEHLTIFWLSTCVGLRYDRPRDSLKRFSRQHGISDFPLGVTRGPHHLSSAISGGLLAWTKTSNTSLT